jgi:hypothetical protein
MDKSILAANRLHPHRRLGKIAYYSQKRQTNPKTVGPTDDSATVILISFAELTLSGRL